MNRIRTTVRHSNDWYNTSEPSVETSPVVDGYMFLTVPHNRVEAFEAKTKVDLAALSGLVPRTRNRVCEH